jgi:hypothetical protein
MVRNEISQAVLVRGDKSLGLVEGMLVYIAWYVELNRSQEAFSTYVISCHIPQRVFCNVRKMALEPFC